VERFQTGLAIGLLCVLTGVGCDRAAAPGGPAAAPGETPPPPVRPPGSDRIRSELQPVYGLIASHKTPEARTALETYRAEHPDDAHAEFLLGLSFHREKRYALARPYFERAVELDHGFHPTWHFLGWCCYYLGDRPAARQAFLEHLAYMPDEGDSTFALGMIALDENRLDDAERRFRTSIAVQADNPRRRREVAKAHARLGDVLLQRDDLQGALVELETAVRLWPQHYVAFFKLSRVHRRLGNDAAADEALRLHKQYQKLAEPPRGVPEPTR
jgi:tetratricopeptide (TPR) repeat protein